MIKDYDYTTTISIREEIICGEERRKQRDMRVE